MDRRQFVAALGTTLVAGCSGTDDESPPQTTRNSTTTAPTANGTTETPTATELPTATETSPTETTARDTTTAESEVLRRVSVESGTVSNEHEVVLSASVLREEATTRQPATVMVVLTNTASEPRSFTTGFRPTFSGVYSESSNQGLVVLSPDEDRERVDSNCWRPKLSPGIPESASTWSLREAESSYVVLELWDDPDNDDCLPPGTYRFEDDYEVGPIGGDERASVTLGFELSVEAP